MKNITNLIKESIKSNSCLHKFIAPLYLKYKSRKKKFYQIIDKKKDDKKLMVDIGAGTCFHRHWKIMEFPSEFYNPNQLVNIDYKHDLTSSKRYPFSDNLVSFFFSANTFEHVPDEFCQHNFNEIYRCLKNGGAFRIQVPDIDCVYNAFGIKNKQFFKKRFPCPSGMTMKESFLYYFAAYLKDKIPEEEFQRNYKRMKKEKFLDFYTGQVPRESQKGHEGNHINWWDYDKLSKMLKKAGFKEIYRSANRGSKFMEMKNIDSIHPETSLFAEAVK